MANYPPAVQRAVDQDYSFDFGDYISQGFNIVTKNVGLFIGATVVLFILAFAAAFLGIIPIVGSIAGGVVMLCLMAGIYLAAKKADDGQILEFGDFFGGFQFFVQLLVVLLIQAGIFMLIFLPAMLAIGFTAFTGMSGLEDGTPPDMMDFPFWIFLLYIPLIYLGVSWSLTMCNVIFHGMTGWDALEASRKIVSKKWFHFFLFNMVVGIIAGAGFLLLGLGALFTIPAAVCMQFALYRDVVGVGEMATARVTDHLVD